MLRHGVYGRQAPTKHDNTVPYDDFKLPPPLHSSKPLTYDKCDKE